MINIYAYHIEKPNNIVVGNNKESIAYKSINEENNKILDSLKKDEYFINKDLQKIYLMDCTLSKAMKNISSLEKDTLIYCDSFLNKENSILEVVENISRDLIVNNYLFDELKSIKKEKKMKNFYLTTFLRIEYSHCVKEGIIIGEAINKSKRLVDLPLNYLDAVKLSDYCLEIGRNNPNLAVRILEIDEIKALKMNSFLAVNQGSFIEPRMIEISYMNNPETDEFIQFIGKGLTFDTGGYSLKPSMINMKNDMAGASVVISVIEAVSKLNLKCNIKILVLATDNKLSANAIVPDDVITSMSGKTIEIVSTDAEGRLTLCDALTYCIKNNNAKKIIDIATLTGSAANTFGSLYSASFSNNALFLKGITDICYKNGEKIWELPLDNEYFEGIKSDIADMKNSGPKFGGASVAAIFLKQFVPDNIKWVHLDIAGSATDQKGNATGVLVKSFIYYLKSLK